MPKILIKEVDQTKAVGSAITDVAYVPGLMGRNTAGVLHDTTDNINKPILCSTVAEFERYFGVKPAVLVPVTKDAQGKPETIKHDVLFNGKRMMTIDNEGNIDKSYVFAKELLSLGMPVIYEAIHKTNNNTVLAEMGACSWTTTTAGEAWSRAEESESLVNNNNNTLSLNKFKCANASHFYVLINNDEKKLYVTLQLGEGLSVEAIYPTNDTASLGKKLENPSASFVTDTNNAYYLVHLIQQPCPEAVSRIEHIRVMVSENGYVPFEYYDNKNDTGAEYVYSVLSSRINKMSDKSLYNVKYLTSGGYPTFAENESTLADKMLSVASGRGDCVAIIDHVNEPDRPLVGPGSLYEAAIRSKTFSDGTYGAMFTPYANYTCNTILDSTISATQVMPASFGYLMCLARAIQTSPSWLAMAGVTRGVVPAINHTTCRETLSNVVADEYQPRADGTAINAITPVTPYGLTVWGNRTLARCGDELVAANFLNTRNMISDIKKQAYATARACMFEQDSDTMWLKFKSGITPLLDSLKSGYGISNYKLIKATTMINGDPLGKGQVAVVIKIYPIYAVEYFEISVVIADDVEVS